MRLFFVFFFFFQAEDGIRDVAVTGVQTCALPILQISRLLRLPRPAARPEAVQHKYAKDEDEAEDPEDWPQEGGGRRRVHRVLQCWCRQRWWLDARPNGSRLSCGALKKDSFPNVRAPAASSAG